MPHIILDGSDISLYYRSNFSKFNPSKATILLLHGAFFSVDLLSPQFQDERLAGKYNMIGFDQLSCGHTINNPDGRKDAYVEAAAIMLALEKLGLSEVPLHVFSAQGISQHIALRLAEVWHERILSLFFCGVGGPEEDMTWFQEVFNLWANATCQADLQEPINALLAYVFGDDDRTTTVDERDEAVAYWLTTFPPNRRVKTYDIGNGFTQESLTLEEYKSIDQPVMVMQGDAHPIYPITVAESFSAKLPKAKLKVVPEGADSLQFPRSLATRYVNPTFITFLKAVEGIEDDDAAAAAAGARSRSNTFSVPSVTEEHEVAFMKDALKRLSRAKKVSGIEKRDPRSVWSFSMVDEAKAKVMGAKLKGLAIGQENAYSPALDTNGKPLHRWSERTFEGLLEPDANGLPPMSGVGILRRPSTDWAKNISKVEETISTPINATFDVNDLGK